MQINVHLLPDLTSPAELAGNTVVVIDILRATTTIIYALAAGADQIMPCQRVEEARNLARQHPGTVLLGGERGGRRIDGFHLGNSPAEYATELVSDATIVFTTTNGTRALRDTNGCHRVLIGAFVNLSAIVASVINEPRLHLVCAGTHGKITREDVLFAGAVVERLTSAGEGSDNELNDSAQIAAATWQALGSERYRTACLAQTLCETRGGRNLLAIGMQDDLPLAASVDAFDFVPELDRTSWVIQRPGSA